jgi:hypothetical protein
MLWLLLASCLATSKVVPVDCACSVELPATMKHTDGLSSSASIQAIDDSGEVGLIVSAVQRDKLLPRSLAGWLTGLNAKASPVGPVSYRHSGGLAVASRDFESTMEGIEVRRRYTVVDNGESVVIAQMFAPVRGWDERKAMFDAVDASLEFRAQPAIGWGEEPAVQLRDVDLTKARASRPAKVTPAPREGLPLPEPPEDSGFLLTHYAAPVGELAAYTTRPPTDGARHAAVVWLEGGFGGPTEAVFLASPEHDETASDFAAAGLVVFAPSFRGEANNPGQVENWYGEQDDLAAALTHVRALPYVDPTRVYLVGHSTGGTHVLLAAAGGLPFRVGVSFGGRADMGPIAAAGGYGGETYDLGDPEAVALRSAIHWADDLKSPVFYFEGDDGWLSDATAMARSSNGKMVAYPVPGADHFSLLGPVKQLIIRKIALDTGAEPNVAFSEKELLEAMNSY